MRQDMLEVLPRLGKLGEQFGDRARVEAAIERSLEREELWLLSHIFKEYGVHKQYPGFVDRIDEMKRKAEATS